MKKQQQQRPAKQTKPIRSTEEVATHPDPRIDQDYPGFPHAPSQQKVITPQSGEEKATAATNDQEGQVKKNKADKKGVLRKELDNSPKKKDRKK